MGKNSANDELVAAELRAERLARRAGWSCAFGGGGLALVVIGWAARFILNSRLLGLRINETTDFFVAWGFILLWGAASIGAVAAIKLGLGSAGRRNTMNRSLAVTGVILGLFVIALMVLPYVAYRLFGLATLRLFMPL